MVQARIISQKIHDPSRKWKITGAAAAFAAAGAVVWYALGGPEDVPEQIAQSTVQKTDAQRIEPRLPQVWGHVAEQDANGQQKPTNDMWGLLLLAENRANQVQYEADRVRREQDIAYSKELSDEDCQTFWVAHMNYQRMRESQNPIHKLEHFLSMPLRPAEFLAQRDYGPVSRNGYQSDRSGYHVTDEWRGALASLLAPAMREAERGGLDSSPELQIEYARMRRTATHYRLNFQYIPLEDSEYESLTALLEGDALREVYPRFARLPQPADLTVAEAERYIGYAYRFRTIDGNEEKYQERRETLGLTLPQAQILARQAKNVVDEQSRQHTAKMQKYTKDHGAPCAYN